MFGVKHPRQLSRSGLEGVPPPFPDLDLASAGLALPRTACCSAPWSFRSGASGLLYVQQQTAENPPAPHAHPDGGVCSGTSHYQGRTCHFRSRGSETPGVHGRCRAYCTHARKSGGPSMPVTGAPKDMVGQLTCSSYFGTRPWTLGRSDWAPPQGRFPIRGANVSHKTPPGQPPKRPQARTRGTSRR